MSVRRILTLARPLLLVAGTLILSPSLLSGQTLIVRGVPAGGAVELLVNGTQAAAGSADAEGDLILDWKLPVEEMDARVLVDICPAVHRVQLVDRNVIQRPQEPGCERRDVVGVFWIRRASTLVVHVDRQIPRVLLRQRDVTIAQLDAPPRRRSVPTGLVAFGGVGLAGFRDAFAMACGTVTPCDGDSSGIGYVGGLEWWPVRALAIEGSVIRTPRPSFEGGQGLFVFTSRLEPTIVATVSGKLGVPVGPVRLYGKGGGIYHRAKLTTEQSVGGETLAMAYETRGWGWQAGGGLEGWFTPVWGIYLEVNRAALKGTDPGGGEARMDERLNSVFLGVRLRVLGGR
jgi:hypothetical protein